MTQEELEELGADLYQELLLDHYRNPRNHGTVKDATIDHEADNPACGDVIHVTAKLDEGSHIEEIRFDGAGCAISQASASILFATLSGQGKSEIESMNVETVEKLLGLTIRSARVPCATLGLNVLKEGLRKADKAAAPAKRLPGF